MLCNSLSLKVPRISQTAFARPSHPRPTISSIITEDHALITIKIVNFPHLMSNQHTKKRPHQRQDSAKQSLSPVKWSMIPKFKWQH